MQNKSVLMRFFSRLGFNSAAWSLRRLHAPVPEVALVLEVGSGGNPYPRSNVLLDAYVSTRERHWVPLVADRPTVLGFVEDLPFKDKSFDFVIASHVLEHTAEPEKFIKELQRVAKAGYIEVPDALLERINPYKDHRLEITCRDETLHIRKKERWVRDPELVDLYEDRVKRILTKNLIPKHPFDFHVRFYWNNEIKFQVINPMVDAGWAAPESSEAAFKPSLTEKFKILIRRALYYFFTQHKRNSALKIEELLRCRLCHQDVHEFDVNHVVCSACGQTYDVRGQTYNMNI